ncbi:glycosyl transferase family 2 [Haloarchaeobius sp. DYHT-AS-18]|uniref:glycosyl transferase family 2 n=1 Tax=Haloarchaeobius sp. DYHT-AS-18 TaxID=3446117 RepID=UPI003EBD6E70
MEYVQERVATLHDLTNPCPDAPTDRTAVVVPMTEREYAGLAAEQVLSTLAEVDPASVIVPLRAPAERVPDFHEWLGSFDLDIELLWCSADSVSDLLHEHGLENGFGKGRDVWLALGLAAERADFVVVHDADTKSYSEAHVPRLLSPLDQGFDFSKGYYARVENNQLYGRLFRLFYTPLVRALDDAHDHPFLDYLDAFRYALAGEFAMTADLARQVRAQRAFGLEVGVLADTYEHAGFEGTAQVDLGRHEHDHRSVSGPTGLSDMSTQVGRALFNALADHGIEPDFDTLPERFEDAAGTLVRQYAADAKFNGLEFDAAGERDQVATYADAVVEPTVDTRLPAWDDAPLVPEDVAAAATDAMARVVE